MATTHPKLQVSLRAKALPAEYRAVAKVIADAKLTVLDWHSWRTYYELTQGQAPKGLEAVLRFRKSPDDLGVVAVVQRLLAAKAVVDLYWQT